MSIRAYRIIEIKVEPNYASFNLYHDEKLMEFLDNEVGFYSQLTDDGTGLTFVSLEVLERAIKRAKSLKLEPDTVECLNKDIDAAKAQDDDYVQYYCY